MSLQLTKHRRTTFSADVERTVFNCFVSSARKVRRALPMFVLRFKAEKGKDDGIRGLKKEQEKIKDVQKKIEDLEPNGIEATSESPWDSTNVSCQIIGERKRISVVQVVDLKLRKKRMMEFVD
ncbi:unnamed protein product [Larinioides sclopetarius]|uniref:Uncharacterized protein n=1 Tax=Larinioides sclopetarius TaxID=280406 RepID=A0AAV1ZZM4_9ARAC